MNNMNFLTVKRVVELESGALLDLLLLGNLTEADNNEIKQNTRALLNIVFKTKDSAPERGIESQTIVCNDRIDCDADMLLNHEIFSRESFPMLLKKIDTKNIIFSDFYIFYESAIKNNQFINFIDLVIKYQIEQELVWLTENHFQLIVKDAIESYRFSIDDFQLLLNKLVIHFMCADKSVIDDILGFAVVFAHPIHFDLVSSFNNKLEDHFKEVKLPEDSFFSMSQTLLTRSKSPEVQPTPNIDLDALKENIENKDLSRNHSPNFVGSFPSL